MKVPVFGRSPKVFIIVLNYEGAEDTVTCLDSLLEISYQNYHVVVVDNGSSDASLEAIYHYLSQKKTDEFSFYSSPEEAMHSSESSRKYTLIQSGVNGGYGCGNNIGVNFSLKFCDTDYVLIINNDTIVDPGFLEPLVEVCEEDNKIGIASGRIYFHDRPDTIWFNGGAFNPYTAKVVHLNYGEEDTGQDTQNMNTFITGCLWLLPTQVIKEVGGINEDYFMYIEDLEYCQRVLNHGFKLCVSDKSKIWHKVGSASGGELSRLSTYYSSRNMFTYIISGIGLKCRITAIIYTLVFYPCRMLFKNNIHLLLPFTLGVFDAFCHRQGKSKRHRFS